MLEKTVDVCTYASKAPDRNSPLDGWGSPAGEAACPPPGHPGWAAPGSSELPLPAPCAASFTVWSQGNLRCSFCHPHPHHALT